jgi:tetratricopeptide (TPR) repeat protein
MTATARSSPPPAVPTLSPDLAAAVRGLHRDGVAATGVGRPTEGARRLRAGLALLGYDERHPAARGRPGGDGDGLAARLLISLAYAEAEQGRTGYGFELLDLAGPLTRRDDAGVLHQQRALMLYRIGRFDTALKSFEMAIPLLLRRPEHAVLLCGTLLNRAALHQRTGHVDAAHADLVRCEQLARRHGFGILAAKAMHSRGICDKLAGDLPAALAAFDAAERLYREHGPGFLPVLTAAKADALLTAGLAEEAGRHLDEVIDAFRRQRLNQEQAEAELLRAAAARDSGDLAAAARWAGRAERRFARRGNESWAALAALTRLRADLPRTRSPLPLVERATVLAARLRDAGLARDADVAELVAVRALVTAGERDRARARLTGLPRRRGPQPLAVVLIRWLARAELARAAGRPGQALGAARSGLAALNERRHRLGSIDLQAGITALGQELATAGLDYAFEHGTPTTLFTWSEHARAQSFRIPPVRPPDDRDAATALAELRQLRAESRIAELAGRRQPGVEARCVELERVIRERSWQVEGPGHSAPVASLPDVTAELRGTGRVMVSFLARRGRLHALVVDGTDARLIGLGALATVDEASTRLLTDLDALAARRMPEALAAVVRGSLNRQCRILSDEILAPLRRVLADREVVIVPTRALSSLPWGLLPDFRGRPVTVSASASAWLGSRRSPGSARRSRSRRHPILVAGPDLVHATAEITEIAKVHRGSRSLTGARATVAATLHGLDGTPVAHLAAHGHHERDNVLFSRLDLADGPLMAYDIQRLAAPPREVSLSACDVGRTVVRAGDEMLGFTAALLYAGTSSVVSCVARIRHDAAATVMTHYHRALADGAEPARALATASLTDPFAPFVCFGSG